jgi:uncharacterized delta-60 repeat protein
MIRFFQWLCIMFVLILPSIIPAQEWIVRYNGPGNGTDDARAIAVDNAGNIYVTGSSEGSGTGTDYATVKYDPLGVEQWAARYNGAASYYDDALAIVIDCTGNVYVTGRSAGSGTSLDYATVKYDTSGVEQWVARYDGPSNADDEAFAIAVDSTGNIYVTGYSYVVGSGYDYATVKYDPMGVEQWVVKYNGPGNDHDEARAIAVDNMGNIYVTGWSLVSGTNYDYATVKYDASGVEQWVARYDGPGNDADYAYAIALDNMGNICVAGSSTISGYDDAYATVKYDSSGVEQWVAMYNGPLNGGSRAHAIAIDNTGDIYVTGLSAGAVLNSDYATVKYDPMGVEQWVARYNGPGNDYDEARAIAVDDMGNIYVTGWSYGSDTYYDYTTVKYDTLGKELWVARYDGPGNDGDYAYGIALDNAGNIYVTGWSAGPVFWYDYATIKYSPTGVAENKLTVKKGNEFITTIFNGPLQLPEGKKCKIYDITGRIVEPSKITRGIYFIEIDGVVTQKVVKIR